MAFDVASIQREMRSAPPMADLPWALAVAIVSDTFRLAGLVPPGPSTWDEWRRKRPRAAELLGELARALVVSALRAETVRALEAAPPPAEAMLEGFFEATEPLTAEMARENPFRQEEFLRDWVQSCGGEVEGESKARSRARLQQLDYRQALAEYGKAEAARKAEAQRRAQLLREAAERAEHAKGWRE